MDYQSIYTSTGCKFIHHPELVMRLKKGLAMPVSLSIAPTSRCNLKCSFCSNVNRDTHEDLDIRECISFVHELRNMGLKAVVITGGGDPTLYRDVNDLIQYCHQIGLKVGMITNGILLKEKVSAECLNVLTWVRISMNAIDYGKNFELPNIKGTLGFSYVLNDKTNDEILDALDSYVSVYDPAYVRMVPDCQSTTERQVENNLKYGEMVKQLGEPYFYQAKVFERPERCYFCYTNPFLLHDGWIYPCSSVVLNDDAEKKFHEKYRMVHMSQLADLYDMPIASFNNESCHHCVFTAQNRVLDDLLCIGSPHNDFV